MMDHARHLSSPSPTSPFLFHHSERSFKSNPLTPLLSSTADATSVDDCFANAPSNIVSHQSHNPFGVEHHQHHHSLVDNHHHHHHHHHQQNHHQRHNDQCVIDQDSLTGVDDDDGMHNMLSGSSTSSTSTMPLLTESHSHHSFSRISLEEYSPLSLVEDCDNALPISPTSLACGSHQSFKTSLNGLKMDNLVGDVSDHEVNDDVNDARSLSPSLLSSANNHHNLWSTSSTAITPQNTSLLNSTSTSFLMSHHHHHHQLNTLMQQLEPQSLDEPPPLINNNNNLQSGHLFCTSNRPSSEPPQGGTGEDSPDDESKSLICQPIQSKTSSTSRSSKQSSNTTTTTNSSSSNQSGRSRKARNRSTSANKQTNSNNKAVDKINSLDVSKTSTTTVPAHSSKLHLQLNHHKKLQELQQRLFGTTVQKSDTEGVESTSSSVATSAVGISKEESDNKVSSDASTSSSIHSVHNTSGIKKEEPDSSACDKLGSAATTLIATTKSTTVVNKTRTRPVRTRRSRAKNESCKPSSSTQMGAKLSNPKLVTTETAEPDTTTKSSECIKLADLLATSTNDIVKNNSNNGFLINGFASTSDTNDSGEAVGGEKRVQQIQLQVNPSLTVVANSSLMQPIGIQQSTQQTNGQVLATGGASLTNQILCRPQAIMTTNGQLKGIVSNNELIKNGETVLTNWSLQTTSNNSNNPAENNSSTNNTNTIGAHQIAIQVICQDGTSLVLPVSSAAGLNAAVSLSSQHQQLQAVLANNSNQQRNSNQLVPLMSVSNIVAQQQVATTESGTTTVAQTTATPTSGLAASSPTLAALLDASSPRGNIDFNNGNFSNQNFVSTNLLRKLVSGGAAELKRGEINLQQGSTLSLTNCGSLVTVCQPNTTGSSNKTISKTGDKRIKLESTESINNNNNIQTTTFTLIDPQGLIVSNGNEKVGKQALHTSTSSSSLIVQQQNSVANKSTSDSSTTKQSKMGSSTGNRQVDPTQPFRCEHCNSTFTRLGNFTRHKKIHTVPTKDGQRFKCDVCSKSFLQRCDLARHLHIHRGTEPHRCNICGKGYIRHSDLVTHQRFHNKEKPFGCPHCSKGFCQRGDLNRHLRSIHLQMKPILCPCCNRKFAKQETLLRHLNTAHRSKPGTNTTNAVIADLPSSYTLTIGDDKQTTNSVVTNAAVLGGSGSNVAQKNAPVASLQAIQATLCKEPQSVDPSASLAVKAEMPLACEKPTETTT